jgi:hypothetical protein
VLFVVAVLLMMVAESVIRRPLGRRREVRA